MIGGLGVIATKNYAVKNLLSETQVIKYLPDISAIDSQNCASYIEQIVADFLFLKSGWFFWFFVPLISFYVCAPFIQNTIIKSTRKELKTFLLVGFPLVWFSWYFSRVGENAYSNIFPIGSQYIIICVAGYYFGRFELCKRTRLRIYFVGLSAAAVIFAGTALSSLHQPRFRAYFLDNYTYPAPLWTLTAVAVFVLFKYADWQSLLRRLNITPRALAGLSACSFGVYLSQQLVFWLLKKYFVWWSVYGVINSAVTFVIVYLSCLALSYCLLKTKWGRRVV